ncbi:MAG: hypothetical protein N2423_04350 [Novosphingobium sp.]|nr:hypothetical protein [Novosphingobium sp.]
MKRVLTSKLCIIAGVATCSVAAAVAARPTLAMLDQLERGNWELRIRGADGGVEAICLDNGRRLIQLRHPDEPCSRVVVEDTMSEVTVHYTCPGRGYGRTHIRRESNRLAQVESQGVARGEPFSFAAEARRTGDCRK